MDAFISHSSANRALAISVEKALEAAGLAVWLDDSELRAGVLLAKELQDSIRNSRVLLLLWSKRAAASRWIAYEWLSAFHIRRFIVPCVVDGTPLPQCLQRGVYLKARRVTPSIAVRLVREIRDARDGPNDLAPVMRGEAPELGVAIRKIEVGQAEVMQLLGEWKVAEAASRQALLNPIVDEALARWPLDSLLINLVGYHVKNAYMIKYWDAIQAGRAQKDPLLEESESRFLDTLSIDPLDPYALNGLGNILFFRRDLDAAEFFHLAAIAAGKRQGFAYLEAEADLELVRRFKRS